MAKITGGFFGSMVPLLNVSFWALVLYGYNLAIAFTFTITTIIAYEFYFGPAIMIWSAAAVYWGTAFASWYWRPKFSMPQLGTAHWHKYKLVNSLRRGEQTHFWSGVIVHSFLTVLWAVWIGFNTITAVPDTFPVPYLGNEYQWTQRALIMYLSAAGCLLIIISSLFDHSSRLSRLFIRLKGGYYQSIFGLRNPDDTKAPGA